MEGGLGVGRTPRLRVQFGGTESAGGVQRDRDIKAEVDQTRGERPETTLPHIIYTCAQQVQSSSTAPPSNESSSLNAVKFNPFRSHVPPHITKAGQNDSHHTSKHSETNEAQEASRKPETNKQTNKLSSICTHSPYF